MKIKNSTLAAASIALMATLPLPAIADSDKRTEVYKRVDENGKVIFSDTAAPDAEKIQLVEPNTAVAIKPERNKPDAPAAAAADSYKSLAITTPKDQEIIPNGLLAIEVKTEVRPSLLPGHLLQLSIDGKVHSTNRSGFTINGMPRGEHRLQVTIIDSEDKVLKQSAAITLYVYRPSS